MNYCSDCGQAITVNDKFCGSCGNELGSSGDNNQPDNSTQQPQTNQPVQDTDAPVVKATFEYSDGRKHSEVTTHIPPGGNLVKDATVEFGNLHPNATWIFFLNYIGQTWMIPLLSIPGAIFLNPLLWFIFASYILASYLAALITYKNYRFEVTPSSFHKEYGIIFKQSASIPFDRIQNVNIRRSLFDRMLQISHIEIETAGTGGAKKLSFLGGTSTASEGYMPGLAVDEAEDIRELLLARAQMHTGNQPTKAPV